MTRFNPSIDQQSTMPSPGILTGLGLRPSSRASREYGRPRRFVMQSHVLSAPKTSPRSLFIAATIAIALYLIGRRLSE
jgi:hypothetical protein